MYVCILIYVHIKELHIHTYVQGGKSQYTYIRMYVRVNRDLT